ncbi:hypothetical protein D9M71_446980 [compost metagenome]
MCATRLCKRSRLAAGKSSDRASARPKSRRVSGVRNSWDTALSRSRCWLSRFSMSPAMVSNTLARLPMLELGEICVRSPKWPLPKRSAAPLRRSRSRQCGRSHNNRQASMVAPIRTLMLQYNRLTSSGSGGTTICTTVRSFSGATASVRQPQSPTRTTFSPRRKRCCSSGVRLLSSLLLSTMCRGEKSLSISAASAGHCSAGTPWNCLTISVCSPRE